MEINGIDRVCLRDSGSSIDVCSRSWINEDDLQGEYVWLKSPLDEICHCLPLAKIKIKTKKGEFYTKSAIKQDSSDNDLYLLGNRTAELLESDEQGVHLDNAVVTRREDGSFIIPAFEGEGGKSLAKVNGVEFKEEIKEYEERRLARELELQRLRAELRNKLNENKLKAGNRINDLANVCILSGNRTTEVSESVNKCRPVNNPVVSKDVENATSYDFEKKNCDPQ
ncbi:integrase_H2C2 domain-containing protein [Trichonephila clavipes]|nr:integrase_H2C2 domain-containing protein [Trichonephila clavipes]